MCQIPWTVVPAIRASVVLISFAGLVKMKGRKKRKGNDQTKEEVMVVSGGGKETWTRHPTLAFIILIVTIQDVASTFLGRLSPCNQCICIHVYSHVHTHTCAHTHALTPPLFWLLKHALLSVTPRSLKLPFPLLGAHSPPPSPLGNFRSLFQR